MPWLWRPSSNLVTTTLSILGSVFCIQLTTKKNTTNKNGMLGIRNLVFVCRNGYEGMIFMYVDLCGTINDRCYEAKPVCKIPIFITMEFAVLKNDLKLLNLRRR